MAQKKENPIHLVSLPRAFPNEHSMLTQIADTLREFSGKTVIILLSEGVLGDAPVSRREGKQLAQKISKLLSGHTKKAFVAYSVIERHAHDSRVITNTGYLVEKPRNGVRVNWQAYPKITMLRHPQVPNKVTVGSIDESILTEIVQHMNSDQPSVEKQRLLENWQGLSHLVPRFPRIRVQGKDVELRVCADALQHELYVRQSARKKNRPAHVILVPAINFGPTESAFTRHLHSNLHPTGFLLSADRGTGKTHYVQRTHAKKGGLFTLTGSLRLGKKFHLHAR